MEFTLCYIIDADKILLKNAARGISKGKWNGAGGKIGNGETLEECASREVFEETGLRVKNLFRHGVLNFHMDGKEDLSFRVHVFSTKNFGGSIKSTEEGEVRWFNYKDVPLSKMWDDNVYWLDLMWKSRKFDADFYYNKENKNVLEYSIKFN